LLTTSQHFSQVIFEGIAGNSFTGDIAIDSVEINSGDCPGKNKSICIFFSSLQPGSLVKNYFSLSAGSSAAKISPKLSQLSPLVGYFILKTSTASLPEYFHFIRSLPLSWPTHTFLFTIAVQLVLPVIPLILIQQNDPST